MVIISFIFLESQNNCGNLDILMYFDHQILDHRCTQTILRWDSEFFMPEKCNQFFFIN